MTPEKMELWRKVCVTDPSAVKPITGKQYKGNSPKPYWIIQRATETFGPCGIGWGIEIVSERFERFGDESLHVAHVRVWYEHDNKRGSIEQMGQTRAEYTSSSGKHIVDEDAPKKSVTDAMVKCLSMLGFAGDIFSGQWDDSKYVEWAREETAKREGPSESLLESARNAANDGVESFKTFWKQLKERDRGLLSAELPSLKEAALKAGAVPAEAAA